MIHTVIPESEVGNVGLLHPYFADARLVAYQAKAKHDYEVGDFVKTAFQDNQDGPLEHMWVLLTDVSPGSVTGTLDNDPVCVTSVKCGDKIVVPHSNISAHVKPTSK